MLQPSNLPSKFICSVNSYDKKTYLKLSTVSIQRQNTQPQSNCTHASQQFFADQKRLLLNYNHLTSKSFRNLDFHGTWNNSQMFPEWAARSSFANFQMLNSLLFPYCHQGKALRHLSHAERDYAVMCLPSTSWDIFDKVCNYITQDRRGWWSSLGLQTSAGARSAVCGTTWLYEKSKHFNVGDSLQ